MTAPKVNVESGVLKPCVFRCKIPTVIRLDGIPGHWDCYENRKTGEPLRLHFLEDLMDPAYAPPKQRVGGVMRWPYWQPKVMPDITDLVQVMDGWNYEMPPIPSNGRTAILDKTGAYLSAASSIDVAHSALVHTPEETRYNGLPGFYKVIAAYWAEEGIPHPLGGVPEIGAEIWVPHTRVQLLQKLADQGRYPEGFILDSWTCGREESTGKARATRLNKWTKHVQEVRAQVIKKYGRYDPAQKNGQTVQYQAVKTNFSQAYTMIHGRKEPGHARSYNPTCRVRRPDWGWAIMDESACTLWRWYDALRKLAVDAGQPWLAPYGMKNTDELVVPYEALDLYTSTPRTRWGTDPLRIENDGITLGTFKVKAVQ